MKKHITATTLGFIATFVANTILAMTIIGPFLNAKIGISRDPEKDGLNFPAILIGYLLLTIFMVWLTPLVKSKAWLQKGLIVGAMTGLAVNVAGHLITAGWSIASGMPMLFAGIIDSFATIVGGIVIAYFLRNYEAK
jgi:hypothetical protein